MLGLTVPAAASPQGIQALLILNAALFLILFFARQSALPSLLALTPAAVVRSFYVWQLATFLFVHMYYNILGFLFNMLALWMFGKELENLWGTQRFLRFYFLCGSGAGVCVILAQYLFGHPEVPSMGATPAIYGMLAAYAALWPEREVIFFFFPMKMKYFVILIAVVDFFLSYDAGLGQIVLLIGLAFGYLYVKSLASIRVSFNPLASAAIQLQSLEVEASQAQVPGVPSQARFRQGPFR